MFEEFKAKRGSKDQRRIGASLAVSSALYLGIAGSVVAASAAARKEVKHDDDLLQIEVAAPPAPEPPPAEPPPPPPEAAPRPKVQRKALELPREIPEERPKEADEPLAGAPPSSSAQEGFTDGVEQSTGTASISAAPAEPAPEPAKPSGPVHLPEKASPPVARPGNAAPPYPEEARKAGLQTVVVAKVTISAAGKVTHVEVLRGPALFHAPVKAALMTWLYEPARLPDGTAISVFRIVTLPFKLENM